MTPEQEKKFNEALATIAKLQATIESLKTANSIPLDIQQALKGRGFLKVLNYEQIDPLAWDSLNIEVPTDPPFPVIEFPIRWLRIDDQNNWYIPVYGLQNLGA